MRAEDELTLKVSQARRMKVSAVDEHHHGQTTVAHGADHRNPAACPQALPGTRSAALGRSDCDLRLKVAEAPDPAGSFRLWCMNEFCCRDGMPCPGMLCLYPGPINIQSIHPHWQVAAESPPPQLPSPIHGGMLVLAGTLDVLGFSPGSRVAGHASGHVLTPSTGHQGHFDDNHDADADADDSADDNSLCGDAYSSPMRKSTSANHSAEVAAFRTCQAAVGDSVENHNRLLNMLGELAEHFRAGRETASDDQTVQESNSQVYGGSSVTRVGGRFPSVL